VSRSALGAAVKRPDGGGARRLVKFLAGVYSGQDYPFDLTELRGLDTALANACLDRAAPDTSAIHRSVGTVGTKPRR
jgi:hypothetical protein